MSQQNQLRKLESHMSETSALSPIEVSFPNSRPYCTSCGVEMGLVEGDVIFGQDWYHSKCWKTVNGGNR